MTDWNKEKRRIDVLKGKKKFGKTKNEWKNSKWCR